MTKREKQQYLVRKRKYGVVHLWTGADTACKISNNKQFRLVNYDVADTLPPGRSLCRKCVKPPKREQQDETLK